MTDNIIIIIGAGGIGRSLAFLFNEYAKRDLPEFKSVNYFWFDDDEVEDENIWTQGFQPEEATNCAYKVDALRREFKWLTMYPISERYTNFNSAMRKIESLTSCSYIKVWVFLACDNLETRKQVYTECLKDNRFSFIDMRVNGRTMMVADSSCSKKELMETLEGGDNSAPTSCLYKWEKENHIINTTPMIASAIGIQYWLGQVRGDAKKEITYINL